jgi:hypothetical protein
MRLRQIKEEGTPVTESGPSLAWLLGALIGFSLATLITPTRGHADARLWRVVEPSQDMPTCEEFYDKWEVPGAPSAMTAMFGLGRGVFAAKSCLDKGDVTTACRHWQGLLAVMDKMGPPLDESRGDLEKLMSEHQCAAAPASNSATEAASSSEPVPDSQANPASESSDAAAGSPDADKC